MKDSRFSLVGLLSLLAINSAMAADSFPRAYDATYESKGADGTAKMHILSNGKGQMRNEITMPNNIRMVIIVDIPAHTTYQIMEAKKMITTCSSEKTDICPIDEVQAKKWNAKNLGARKVNGHMCQGWSYQSGQGHTKEVWMDKETQAMVRMVDSVAGLDLEFDIKTLSKSVPASTQFDVPSSGYKVVSSP